MKAFGYEEFGSPEVFKELDVAEPELTSGDQVIVRTQVIGLNNFERAQRAGLFGGNLPIIPGRDAVGEIIEVGSDVQDYQLGETVVVHGGPAYAEKVVVSQDHIAKVPDGIAKDAAVALVTPGITAYNMVNYFTHVSAGQTVLIIGATGGVGSIAVQVAKDRGAHVIGVGSSKNEGLLKSLGVDEIGLYDTENIAEKFADRADVVLNAAMNGNNDELIDSVVKADGEAASVGAGNPLPTKTNVQIGHAHPVADVDENEVLGELVRLLGEHKIQVDIFKQLPFSLAGVVEGHQILEAPHAPGRVVIVK